MPTDTGARQTYSIAMDGGDPDPERDRELTRADIMTKLRPDGNPYTNRKAAETACQTDGDALKALEYLLGVLARTCKCDSGGPAPSVATLSALAGGVLPPQ
jgi:hypothetical protein